MSVDDYRADSERSVLTRCLELFQRGSFIEADRLARDAVQVFPDSGDLWQLHGLLRRREGDFENAGNALETASLLVPLSPAAQCALADCHARARRRDLAHGLYVGLAQNPACPTTLLPAVASGLGAVGDPVAALEVCRELTHRDPANHQAYFGAAYYMRQLGHDAATVLPTITRAHVLFPASTEYRILMASLLAQLGHYDKACALIRDVKPDAVQCAGCVRRIMAILDRGGEVDALSTFQSHATRSAGQGADEPR